MHILSIISTVWLGHHLVFESYCHYKIPRRTTLAGALNKQYGKIGYIFWTEIAVYLGNGTRPMATMDH